MDQAHGYFCNPRGREATLVFFSSAPDKSASVIKTQFQQRKNSIECMIFRIGPSGIHIDGGASRGIRRTLNETSPGRPTVTDRPLGGERRGDGRPPRPLLDYMDPQSRHHHPHPIQSRAKYPPDSLINLFLHATPEAGRRPSNSPVPLSLETDLFFSRASRRKITSLIYTSCPFQHPTSYLWGNNKRFLPPPARRPPGPLPPPTTTPPPLPPSPHDPLLTVPWTPSPATAATVPATSPPSPPPP